MANKYLLWLAWPEKCFRANASDVEFLKSLVGRRGRVVAVRSRAAFLRELPGATHAICWEFDGAWFARAPKLRVLATPAAGRELLPADSDVPHGVRKIHGAFHGAIMAETVAACVLAHARGLCAMRVEKGLWPRVALSGKVVRVAGSKAVILGYGHVGRAIGDKLAALGVEVKGIRRRNLADLKPALAAADWLVVSLPSDTGTDDIVDAAVLRAMKRTAVLVNVGRGNAVDEKALAAALRRRRIAAAFLDVFKLEPLDAGSPLAADLPGLFRLPHASAFSPDYLRTFFRELADSGALED